MSESKIIHHIVVDAPDLARAMRAPERLFSVPIIHFASLDGRQFYLVDRKPSGPDDYEALREHAEAGQTMPMAFAGDVLTQITGRSPDRIEV